MTLKLGFIGQGYVGKNYADYYERNDFEVVRYSNELSYKANKETISHCDIVFIAVPTPTTTRGFDDSIVREVLGIVGEGRIAIIKSTIIPGTTEKLQKEYPSIYIFNSPEFLSERTVTYDIENPDSNVIGMPIVNDEYRRKAELITSILPKVPNIVCTSIEAELMKYAHNVHGFIEIIYSNMLYDLGEKFGADWNKMKEFMEHDRFMVSRYASPVHASGHTDKAGRGAGGHCFIKDFKAFREVYQRAVGDPHGLAILKSLEEKNIELLTSTGKDLDMLREVYGDTEKK